MEETENNRKDLSKLAKMIKRATLFMSAEGLGPMVVGAIQTCDEMCPIEVKADERNTDAWTWVWMFVLVFTWCLFACVLWKFWKRFQQHDERLQRVENDIYYCWRQVAGEDEYIAQQASRMDTLHNQVMMYDGRLVEMRKTIPWTMTTSWALTMRWWRLEAL